MPDVLWGGKAPVFCVVAVESQGGMGYEGGLPWHFPEEVAYFRGLTTETHCPGAINRVVMGRKTWESIPAHKRPLAKRQNVVLSREPLSALEGVKVVSSLEEALGPLVSVSPLESIFLIGGRGPFMAIMDPMNPLNRRLQGVYVTHIHASYPCDVFFPALDAALFQPHELFRSQVRGVDLTYTYYAKIQNH